MKYPTNPTAEQMAAYRKDIDECLARKVCQRTKNEVMHFLELFAKNHGKAAADKLHQDARDQWVKLNRSAA